MSTKTKIAFRAKKKSRQALAAVKTVRLPGRSSPKSIHLGYVSLDSGLTTERLDELDARLQEAWMKVRGYDGISIDRADAREKWSRATGLASPSKLNPVQGHERGADADFSPAIFRLAQRVASEIWSESPHHRLLDEDDLAQIIAVRVLPHLASITDEKHLYLYLRRAARTALVDIHRKEAASGRIYREGQDMDSLAALDVDQQDLLDQISALHDALDDLRVIDPEIVIAIEARMFRGEKLADIAEPLGIGLRTLDRRLRSAMDWLSRKVPR